VESAWAPLRALSSMRSRIGERVWEELLADAPVAHATAGTVIFRTGGSPRLAAITSGLVRVFTWGPGGRQVPLRYARPGDLIGLGALLSGSEMLSAEAVADTTLAMVSLDRLHALASGNPELAWTIAKQLAIWSAAAVATLLGAGFEQMTVRVAQHLVDLAVPTPDGNAVACVTHRALADAVGTVREVVTRVLGEFREQGIVCTRPGRVIVLEPSRLAGIAAGVPAALAAPPAPARTAERVTDIPGRPVTVDRLLGQDRLRRRPPPPEGT
jgi:CRP-like cAMP-binding protein